MDYMDLFYRACPQCGRRAVEEVDYLNDEKFVSCGCCGYNFTREKKYNKEERKSYFEEQEFWGYGVLFLRKRDRRVTETLLNSPVTDQEMEKYKKLFSSKSKKIKRKKSYLVLYQKGEFNIIFGHVPEDFHLSFEEYKEKYNYNRYEIY